MQIQTLTSAYRSSFLREKERGSLCQGTKKTTDGREDTVEISGSAQQVDRAKNALQITNGTGFPPGFPEDTKNKILQMEQEHGAMNPAVIMVKFQMVGMPMAESAYSNGTLQNGAPDADVFQRGGFDVQKHIQRLIQDTQDQIGKGVDTGLNNDILALLYKLKQ